MCQEEGYYWELVVPKEVLDQMPEQDRPEQGRGRAPEPIASRASSSLVMRPRSQLAHLQVAPKTLPSRPPQQAPQLWVRVESRTTPGLWYYHNTVSQVNQFEMPEEVRVQQQQQASQHAPMVEAQRTVHTTATMGPEGPIVTITMDEWLRWRQASRPWS